MSFSNWTSVICVYLRLNFLRCWQSANLIFYSFLHWLKSSYSKFVSCSNWTSVICVNVKSNFLSCWQLANLIFFSFLHPYKLSYSKFVSCLASCSNCTLYSSTLVIEILVIFLVWVVEHEYFRIVFFEYWVIEYWVLPRLYQKNSLNSYFLEYWLI